MCPVRWNLKNQRTAPTMPIADILCRVGISMGMVVAARTEKAALLPGAQCPAAMAALARIRHRHFLYWDTSQARFVGDELLQLEKRPVVAVLARIRFRSLALHTALADAREVFKPYASIAAVRQSDPRFGETVVEGNLLKNPPVGILFIDFERQQRLRLQGIASIREDDTLLAAYPGAQFIVRVQVTEVYWNCPRYIHKYRCVEWSEYVPRAGSEPPIPAWKLHEELRPLLPANDPARTSDS
jgi:hypothetical protein